MKQYKKIYNEDLSYLQLYKHGDEIIIKFIDYLMKKFNSSRADTCRGLATLLDELATEAEDQEKAKQQPYKKY
jgi:hypothetical protein